MIYLDNAATSKPSALALKAFVEASELYFANSASPHKAGRESNRLVESSRSKILKAVHLENSHKCLFCSGATEANNLALKGVAFQYARRGKTIITDMGEHSSVKNACKELGERFGYNIVSLPLNEEGKVDPKELEKAPISMSMPLRRSAKRISTITLLIYFPSLAINSARLKELGRSYIRRPSSSSLSPMGESKRMVIVPERSMFQAAIP